MPSKYRIILEMASQTARDIASNADRYTDFLITAANNYKYSFKEQLLIHAQKPDATACAEIDTWNKLGRWVNKGTKDIALLIDRDVPYKLRHVFDISDTNSRAGRNITLWQMKPEYEYAVSESLQASFGDVEEPRDFPHLLMDISGYAVEDNLSDYLMELNAVKAGNFLEELDDTSLRHFIIWIVRGDRLTCSSGKDESSARATKTRRSIFTPMLRRTPSTVTCTSWWNPSKSSLDRL